MTYRFQEVYESTIQDILASGEIDADSVQFEEIISDALLGAVEEAADSILATIKSDTFADGIEELRGYRLGFEERLASKWGEAFDLYELLVSMAEEMGSDFNDEFREDAVRSHDAAFEALTRLQGRACQVAKEVLVLMRSGYADGAHARWRTLHEISVVACLIGDHGRELAKRYVLHEKIQQYKMALQYRDYCEHLGLEPISSEEFSALEEVRNKLVSRFGNSFKNDYGWASSVIEKERPTFADLEEQVSLDHWRPYYRAASDNVHANVHGALFRNRIERDARRRDTDWTQ